MGLDKKDKIALNSTNIHEVRKLFKEHVDREDKKEKHRQTRNLIIGYLIIVGNMFYDKVAEWNTWQYNDTFGARQWQIVFIGLCFIAPSLFRVAKELYKEKL